MENYKIRRSTEQDITGIVRLYDNRKSNDELEWLLLESRNPCILRSFVAINSNNEVCGHIGYIVYNYRINKEFITGMHPLNWIVSPSVSGPVGLLLLKEVIKIGNGDFTFMIGGSQLTRKISPLIRFPLVFHLIDAIQVINWFGYYNLQKGNSFRKIIKTTMYFLQSLISIKRKKYDSNIHLEKYNEVKYKQISVKNVFYNDLSDLSINWLINCPIVNSYAFIIKKKKEIIGYTILYIYKNNTIKTGRIVHISFLEEENDWIVALNNIYKFFKDNGCSIITALGCHPVFIKCLKNTGYIFSGSKRPVYIRDDKKIIKDLSLRSMHFTFCEADMGYRGM